MRADIIEEHAEDAAFCFEHRQGVLESLTIHARYLSDLDERLVAHVDGLVVAERAGRETAQNALSAEEPASAFVAAAAALGSAGVDASTGLEEGLLSAEPESFAAMQWAIRFWPALASAGDRAERWLASDEERLQAAALTALTASGRLDVAVIERVLRRTTEPQLLRAALSGAAMVRDSRLLPLVVAHLGHQHPTVRSAAFETAMLLDPRLALEEARRQVLGEHDPRPAARALGLVGEAADASLLASCLVSPSQPVVRVALLALGNLGSPEAVEALLAVATGDDGRARVAGFSLRRILGPLGVWTPRVAKGPSQHDDVSERSATEGLGDDEAGDDARGVDSVGEGDAEDEQEDLSWSLDDDLPLWSVDVLASAWQRQRPQVGNERLRAGRPLAPRASSSAEPSPLGVQHDEALEEALAAPSRPPRDTRGLRCPPPFRWRTAVSGGGSSRA